MADKSTGFYAYPNVPNVLKFGGSGISAVNASQTFLFDLDDAAVSFTPYIATQTYRAKLSVYGSKDGEIWLPLVLNEQPDSGAMLGNNSQWNPDNDTTELGELTAWSNYNTANMNTLLTDNAEKKVYLKFNYIGDGTLDAEARAFGITAAYDKNATVKALTGVENYISSAGNRSAEGAYFNIDAPENDIAKETYFQKYMLTDQSFYRGLTYVAQFGVDNSKTNKVTFKYDLNDSTTSFIPTVWVNTATNAKIKIEASKDGVDWYEIVSETVTGDGVNNGVVYGDATNVAYIDSAATNYCTVKAWATLSTENVDMVLSGNDTKTVYIRFSHVGAPDAGTANFEYRGFGVCSSWQAVSGTETFVAEVLNRDGVDGFDASKSNYFNAYRIAGKSTSFVSYGHAPSIIKFGGSGATLNSTQAFLFDLNDATVSFTPYIVTNNYYGNLSIYGSQDGEIWLPLVFNEEPGIQACRGNADEWNPSGDVTDFGTPVNWLNYNIANMNELLKDNAEKKIYLKFNYIGDGTDATQAEAKAFGITAAYEANAKTKVYEGVENYISSAGNRSAEGAYLNSAAPENDSTKETYFQKYMLTNQSYYRGLTYVAEFNANVSSVNRVTFKYDLNDNTVNFIPTVWVNTNTNTNIKIEASKDGNFWYEIVNETVTGDGVTNGIVYGDTANVAYIDSAAANYCTSKSWTTLNAENIEVVLKNNNAKNLYLRFSRGGDISAENFEYRGFGVVSHWVDYNLGLSKTVETESTVSTVVMDDGVAEDLLNVIPNILAKNENIDFRLGKFVASEESFCYAANSFSGYETAFDVSFDLLKSFSDWDFVIVGAGAEWNLDNAVSKVNELITNGYSSRQTVIVIPQSYSAETYVQCIADLQNNEILNGCKVIDLFSISNKLADYEIDSLSEKGVFAQSLEIYAEILRFAGKTIDVRDSEQFVSDVDFSIQTFVRIKSIVKGIEMGDVINNGKIDATDLAALRCYLLGYAYPEFDVFAADANCDGDINIIDIVREKKISA